MNRKLKALGAALLAAMAVGAVAVGSASGTSGGHFVSDGEPTTLDITGDNHFFEASGIKIECTESLFSSPDVTETETSIEVTPEYSGCYTPGEHIEENEVKVTMNSCYYVFTIGKLANEDNTVHIECDEPGDLIEVHTTILGDCTLDIPEQTSLTGVSYTNEDHEGVHDIGVEITVDEITYERTEGDPKLFGCRNLLGAHGTDGEYIGDATVTGTSGNEPVDVTATGSED